MGKYEITGGKIPHARKVLVYGPEGVGKSTFASRFPQPLFIDTEGSTRNLDVMRMPTPTSWPMLLDEVATVAQERPCQTLVIDTADWAERMCARDLCMMKGWQGIEDAGWGKGYTYLGIVGGVTPEGRVCIEQRNKFSAGEQIEIMKPDGSNPLVTVEEIRDEEGNLMESAPHPQQKLQVRLSGQAEIYDILRRKEEGAS